MINLELIQDKYTNFIIYDGSDRNYYPNEYIPINDITRIDITLKSTSEYLTEDHKFILDESQAAIYEGQSDVDTTSTTAWSGTNTETLVIKTKESVARTITFDTSQATVGALVIYFQGLLDTTLITDDPAETVYLGDLLTVYAISNTIAIKTVNIGIDEYINISGGTVIDTLGWVTGIYRGNEIPWGSIEYQDQLQYKLYYGDISNTLSELPTGYWDVEFTTTYTDSGSQTYTVSYREFSYKQFELYEARLYEWQSRQMFQYADSQYGYFTNGELWIRRMLDFSSRLTSLKAAIEVNNTVRAQSMRDYLTDFITLNPLPYE